MENSKIVNLDALDKIAKELRKKALADISQQEEEIEKVRDMFGGKSFRYVLQEEYNNLSEEEKNDPYIVWSIVDAEEPINKEYVDEEITKLRDEMIILEEDDLTTDGLIDNTFPSLTTEDKTLLGAINEINSKTDDGISREEMNEILMEVFGITLDEEGE